tara:strand:- start:1073 stop:2221 length:1149 start_codon:yes stop_codon:yes gene_type:complete
MEKIPYGRQNIDQSDIEAVVATLKSDYLTQGPKTREFETKFAEYIGANYALAVNNATSGLHLSVLALNLTKGDRVITTPITFAASANCVRYVGGEVWFADIDPNTYLLDVNAVRQLIESKPKGFFKGIIPVDFAGLPVNMEVYRKLANEHKLWIIEDACHAPGGSFKNSKGEINFCGNGNYADISVFSFHPVKHIACGEGGMLTTNSKELYDKLTLLRTHGITKENIKKDHGGWYYEMEELGFNYRLTDFQSALGITQLAKNKKGVDRRNKIASVYKIAFEGKIKFQDLPTGTYNAHHLFVIEIKERKELYDFLHSEGILVQIHYIPIHFLHYYKRIGYQDARLINAENYYSKCLSLPMYPSLSNKEQKKIIELINFFFNLR